MKFTAVVALILCCSHMGAAITPVGSVLKMLSEMKTKGGGMLAEEKATYAKYKEWVDDMTTDLGFEIKTAEKKITELVAFATKADSDVKQLGSAIAALEAEIAKLEAEKKSATATRDEEHAEFLKLEKDYSESVDALTRAIQHVSAQAYDRPQAEAFLQRLGATRVLAALQLQQSQAIDGAPAVDAYETQTGGVLAILEKLLDKFKGELDDLVTDEGNKAHYFSLQELHIDNTVKDYSGERDEKVIAKAKRAEASEKAKGELAATRTSLAEDKKFLSDMTATFNAKSATYATNQEVRAQELEALGKAIEIISTDEVSGSYEKHVNLAQIKKSGMPALVQLGSSKRRLTVQQRASDLLKRTAAQLSSSRLSALAARAADSPFVKVIDMIETLLDRLKEEAAAEATHKEWCDEQLKENKLKREKKTSSVNLLTAEFEERKAQIETMTADLATLAKEQEELNKAMMEAESVRSSEAKENAATIADAKAGQAAVKQALAILKEFYSTTEFVQVQGKQVPEMEEYKGMGGEKKGVVGMLEVILTDFERLEADTTAAETQAASDHESFMSDSKAAKEQKHKAEVQLKLDKDQAEFENERTKKDLDAVAEELAEANKYYETLKPSCLEVKVSYEERVEARKKEIEALKQAHAILESKSAE